MSVIRNLFTSRGLSSDLRYCRITVWHCNPAPLPACRLTRTGLREAKPSIEGQSLAVTGSHKEAGQLIRKRQQHASLDDG